MKYENILIREFTHSAEIILNRPEKHNALNEGLISDLKRSLTHYESREEIRFLSLKAQGKSFCSGADLNHLKKMRDFSREENLQDSLDLGELYLKIYTYSKPVIAIVKGPALAGGCGLASVCDFILATGQAQFGYPEVKIGFIAALVSIFLTRQVGERKAKELLLSGKIISAIQAMEIGLINNVYTEDEIDEREQELISLLLKNSSTAMAHTKKLFSENIETILNNLAQKNAEFRECKDFIEGISSFIEKRKPKWSVS